ncbi:zinc finger protein 513-like isoform X2 [Nerophis lumbriciformis]|uniref:zinc finger protein 513-like isoform X2 n=1 Tax=Nerophis lumbriciformis TaxID=546530 RepID=UPI002ADF20E7|nr:zinc finger protein 513-like isoform X2 [Nerophis lumbriciformis]
MPRRKQSNPQPVKLELDGGGVACDTNCLILESDVILSKELEFGDSEMVGLDQDNSVTMFSLSVDEDSSPLPDTSFPAFLSCKGCGQLLCHTALEAEFDLGVGLDLGAALYCLTCEPVVQRAASVNSAQAEDTSVDKNKVSEGEMYGAGDLPRKVHSCSLCTFTSRYSNHLKRHMRIHDGQKPHRCPLCPYASAQLVNLQRHTRTHTGEKPYHCHQCSYACSSLGNLRRHQRLHAQERRPRRDQGIRKAMRRKEKIASDLTLQVSQDSAYLQMQDRLTSASNLLPVLLFPLCCRLCGLTLEEADMEDVNMEDGEDGEWQVCRRCSLDSLIKDGMARPNVPLAPREPRRRGNKLYRCSLCPFLSRYPNHLVRHSHTHSDEKPHPCPHCPYTSSHLDNLKRHMRVHTGEKPYQCPSCIYACGNLANLRRHERIHSGAKPFHCDICSYSCNQSMNLKRHMLRHSGEKPYACGECDYTTGHLDNYKRHQRKHGHWDQKVAEHSLN